MDNTKIRSIRTEKEPCDFINSIFGDEDYQEELDRRVNAVTRKQAKEAKVNENHQIDSQPPEEFDNASCKTTPTLEGTLHRRSANDSKNSENTQTFEEESQAQNDQSLAMLDEVELPESNHAEVSLAFEWSSQLSSISVRHQKEVTNCRKTAFKILGTN